MMDPSEYYFDLWRIFFGDYSIWIYLEILLRVLIIMSYTILIIKFIGKRAVGTIDSADVLLIIAMGSCVGDAMFYPSIPLFVSIAVITLIGLLQHLYTYIAIKYEGVRVKIKPTVVKIVENGISGFVAHPSNHQEYANKILQLLDDTALRKSMELKAKERILTHFEINLIANQNLAFYQKIVEQVKRAK